MSYQVLARKWRPQNFTEMVGQEHVLRALINALDSDRLHHAYLFTGTRGVGKTTIARILAKCLNCETGVTSKPCGTCSACTEITTGNFVDLIEVDAASRTKVEDTRELLENVQYAPTRARFKVYLIDEVHMLTGHSFNALLKTLEEPPPHVKFLFATTDPQKLPATILSRCLQFNLKRMPVDLISGHLEHLLKEENIDYQESALKLIARAADGSMRDALSLLDQSIAFSGENINEDSVRDMLGSVSQEPLLSLLKAISENAGESLLQQVEDISSITPDFEAATDALIELLHNIAVQQIVPNAVEDNEELITMANTLSKEDVQLFYQIALQGRKDISLAPDAKSGFEMLLLRMMSFRPFEKDMVIEQESKKKTLKTDSPVKAETQNKKSDSKPPIANSESSEPPWDVATSTPIAEQAAPAENLTKLRPSEPSTVSENLPWHKIVKKLSVTGRAAELIKHCVLQKQDNAMISLMLDKGHESLLSSASQQDVNMALQQFYGAELQLSIQTAKLDIEETVRDQETPAQRKSRKEQENQHQAEQNIESDPFVIELQNRYNAQIVPGSIQPKKTKK